MTTLSATKNFRVIPLIFILAIIFSTCEKPERIAEIASTASSEADISFTSVILKGEITDLGSAPIEDFGIIVSENASFLNPIPLSANKQAVKGPFQIEFTGLKINTLYYFRAYLTITGEDPIYGKTLQFRTKDYSTPAVTAGTVNSITMTSASLQGEVTSDGGESGTIRGLCWALTANPTITSCLDSTVNGSGKGTFTGSITGLAAGTRYYVRTYARNSKGTAYNSADIEFRTHDKPKVTTTAITSISASGCSTGGNVSDDGEVPVTARGVCWSTSTGPTADLTTKTVDGSGKGEFTSEIGGLVPGVLYYVRAYATNQYGTGYGSELSFTTFKAPNALTLDATLIGNTTATLNGSINTNGFTTTVVFEYGTSTAYGSTITAVQSPVTGAAITNVHANITGLNPGTTYHFRVLASNSGGDYTANDMSFTTVQPSDAITDPASAITTSSVTLNGRINAKNSSSMVSFEYGLTTSYGSTIAASPGTVTGNTLTTVSAALSGLTPRTEYHYRVRSISDGGTTYGEDLSFRTLKVPDASTSAASSVTAKSAVLTASVNAFDSETTVTFEYGLTTSYGTTVNADQNPVNGSTATIVSAPVSGLNEQTEYHYRVKAVSVAGTTYGTDMTFTTLKLPVVSTDPASLIGNTTVTLNGKVDAYNSESTVTFEYGTTTSYGTVVSATPGTVTGYSNTPVLANLTGLTPGTTYHFRVKAVSAAGTSYGGDQSFITSQPPLATVAAATSITTSSATLNGSVNANNLSTSVSFEYGLSTTYGSSVTGTPSPVSGNSNTAVSASISGLLPGTSYHYRVTALSSGGTTNSSDGTFTTEGAVTDYDGNLYNTVIIGTQTWLSENLKVTHYRNGDPIPNLTDNTAWAGTQNGAYTWYNNDLATHKAVYGGLYNYYATVDNRNLCPAGWHVPTQAEWTTLINYLGGATVAGGKLKESGTSHWTTPNTGADNSSGFTALPGGVGGGASFGLIGVNGRYWTSSELSGTSANALNMHYTVAEIQTIENPKTDGLSVRCIKGEGVVLPAVTTTAATAITSSGASTGGNVSSEGGSPVIAKGVCYGTSENPTIAGTKTTDGNGTGSFTSSLSGLAANTTYHVRAYATNSIGTAYGTNLLFKTLPAGLTVTDADGNVYSTVTIGTQVWMGENLKTTKYRDGTSIPNPTDNAAWTGTNSGAYSFYNNDVLNKNIYGALYNFNAVVDNHNLCPTGWRVPTYNDMNTLSVFLGGETVAGGKMKETGLTHWLTPNTGATNESGFTGLPGGGRGVDGIYSLLSNGGWFWTSTQASETAAYFGLLVYHGTGFGPGGQGSKNNGYSVRCLQGEGQVLPALTTTVITAITATGAASGGTITSDGGSAVTARGVCWSTSANPTIADAKTTDLTGTGTFTSSITGLAASTTYHVRAYATNDVGTAYGNDISFTTSAALPTVTDYDGNIYSIVTIGTQEWMGSNLKTTKYNDGLAIPLVSDQGTWGGLTTHAFCWYGNDEATYKSTYGAMYNWYAVNTGKLCPSGWHIPTDAEWTALATYLGGTSLSGGKLKEAGLAHWLTPNTGATDEVGFTALPGGYRGNDFYELTRTARWWSLTESGISAWTTSLSYTSASQSRIAMSKMGGMSVRCIKGTYPLVESAAATSVTSTTATLNGRVNPNSVSTVVTFEYGLTTGYGSEITATQSPLAGTTFQSVSASASSLAPNTTYHFRVKAVNTGGTSYGTDMTFTTPALPPSATTGSATSVTANTATLAGTVNANGVSSTVTFEYGTTTGYGTEVTADQSPVAGSTNTAVSKAISGLTASTTYHFRVKAVSAGGTTYGGDQTFTTSSAPLTVTDIDGNVYNTVVIGTQIWMKENLKATRFNDGVDIPLVSTNGSWEGLSTPGMSYESNNVSNKDIYGGLYNWYVGGGTRNPCPSGWHVPSEYDFGSLIGHLGGESVAGGKMKATGTDNWNSPNADATNSSQFTGLGGGFRSLDGGYGYLKDYGSFWSTDEGIPGFRQPYSYHLVYSGAYIGKHGLAVKTYGHSIRCLKGEANTGPATSISTNSATLTGSVNANGNTTQVFFEYGLTTSYGSSVSAVPGTVTGINLESVSVNLTGLQPARIYHYRIKAVNAETTTFGRDHTFTTNATFPLSVGDAYAGGIVFYVDGTGMHGMVAATSDQISGTTWAPDGFYDTSIPGTSTSFGTGSANTNTIVSICGTGSYAAGLCYDLSLNGYTDWFLPSKDELDLMYQNLKLAGIGYFGDGWYWSSSQGTTYQNAWVQRYDTGDMGTTTKTSGNCVFSCIMVRAVRSF